MTYTKFGTFLEEKNVQIMNENVDRIVESIIESSIPFEVFYTECLLPILTESQTEDPNELLSEVESWFQRNMPTFSRMFGGSKQEAPNPEEEAAAKNQAFNQKHSNTFDKIKKMFIDGLKKTATEMQGNVSRYPNAKMLVTAIQSLVQNAAKATQGYQFKQGSSDEFYNKFQANQAQAGQQKAILGALQSGNAQALLKMPDDQIIKAFEQQPQMKKLTQFAKDINQQIQRTSDPAQKANLQSQLRRVMKSIEQQPQMRQQLTQLAKNINQQIQVASDPAQKANLQSQLRRVMNLTKFGMGSEFVQSAAKGQAQRDQFTKMYNDRAAQAQAQVKANAEAKERQAFDDQMFDQLMKNPNPERRPKSEEELQFELDRLWKLEQKKRAKTATGSTSVTGGPQPIPSPSGTSSPRPIIKDSTCHQDDMLIESLIRCTGIGK